MSGEEGQQECGSWQHFLELSPKWNLPDNLNLDASYSKTPRKRLSLSSCMSDTPQSCHKTSFQHCSGVLQDSPSWDSGRSLSKDVPVFSPGYLWTSYSSDNFPSSDYCQSPSADILPLPRKSKFKPLQKKLKRILTFSPVPKDVQLLSPAKQSSADDVNTKSRDSDYAETTKQLDQDHVQASVALTPGELMSQVRTAASTSSGQQDTSQQRCGLMSPPAASSSKTKKLPFRKCLSFSTDNEDKTLITDLLGDLSIEEGKTQGLYDLLASPINPSITSSPKNLPLMPPSVFDHRPSGRRFLSLITNTSSSSRDEGNPPFKRPRPARDQDIASRCKRRRLEDPSDQVFSLITSSRTGNRDGSTRTDKPEVNISAELVKPKFQRSQSESQVSVMKALAKSEGEEVLTGDFSRPVLLPTVKGGKHPDLKAISVDTMAEVVRGKYANKINSCRIIDCRYPYEYQGGHIRGAETWHHPEMVGQNLQAKVGTPVVSGDEAPRQVLIFHCEFSAERGPKAQRLLREMDRAQNKQHYPALHFPEIYLLEGGYKAFFEKYPSLCTPGGYVTMLDSSHTEDLRYFRSRSKSWAADMKKSKKNTVSKTGLRRLLI